MTEHRPDTRRTPEPSEPRPLVGVAPSLGVGAGASATLRIAVTNASQHPRVLSVAALGVDAAWADGQPHTPVLEPGGTAVVEIRLSPPVGTLPARYPLVVAAQALDPESGRPTSPTGTAETTLVVNPRTQLSLELEPQQLRLIGSRRFTVSLTNGGAATAKVLLKLQAGAQIVVQLGGLDREIEVGPGETRKLRGRVRVKKPQMLGPKITHSFTLTARGTESVRHVDGLVVQRGAIGPSAMKAIALLLVLAVWVGAGVVFIPALAQKIRTSSEESAAAAGPGGEEAGEESADPGAAGGEDGGAGGEEGGADGGGEAGEKAEPLQLAGTIAADQPGDVSVGLRPIALVDEDAQGGVGVGVDQAELTGAGMRLSTSFVPVARPDRVAPRSVKTAEDGSWAFAKVKAPGYYLLTFSKPGFQTQRFVVDSSSAAAAEPLDVDLVTGEGFLSGRITGPGGRAVGGAAITITDGTNTLTTSSNSEGDIGAWSVSGLSTPSTYVITATKHGMSSEARVVTLDAGATGTADLALVPGVATLTGKVSAAATDKGLAGISVSVSDSTGAVRTATTLTQPRGQYAVPTLPTPGTYTITFSGDGFQSRTRVLELKAGESPEPLTVALRASTGEVTGITSQVSRTSSGRKKLAGLENAGLTLANADHTYKTTSTSTPEDGTFGFSGVAPGTYVLTTRYFGLVTDHTTVQVEPGGTVEVDPEMEQESGSGVPAEASITGTVVDATTGLSLPVCPDTTVPRCIHVEVTDPGVKKADGATSASTYPIEIAPDTGYELPDPDATYPDGVVPGLRPGLHTVRVTAPGYESGSVDVEVGSGESVEAPLVELFPAPRVEGTITTTLDAAVHPSSCVFVRTEATVGDPLPTCTATTVPAMCVATPSTYDGTDPDATSWCAMSDANGTFSVQVSKPGTYAMTIVPTDVEYVPQTVSGIELDHGETTTQSPRLDRYGRLKVRVLAPDGDDALSPAADLPVYSASEELPDSGGYVVVSPDPRVADADDTDTDGYTTISGLLAAQSYTISGTVVVATDPAETGTSRTTLTGSVSAQVAFNDEATATLRLTKPLSSFVGRVTGQVDGVEKAVTNASVVIKAAISFADDGAAEYGTPITATTDSVGCFGIDSSTTPKRGTACTRPGQPADATSTSWETGSLARRQMVTNVASTVEITASGYETLTLSKKALSTVNATPFSLSPTPITFGASVRLNPAPVTAPDWSLATVTVTDSSPVVAGVTSSITARAGDAARGDLGWTWTRTDGTATTAGTVLPGSYGVTVELPGYQKATGTLVCAVGDDCAWASELVLHRLGQIEVHVIDDDTEAAIASPYVIKHIDGTALEQTANTSGVTTFSGIASGTNQLYRFEARAAGYKFGTSNTTPGASDDVVLDCDGSAPGTVTVAAGQTTICRVRLTHRLGTISGTLRGILGPQGTTGPDYEHLTGVRVTATRCVDAACATLTDEKRTEITTLADTASGDLGGRFTFRGTSTVEGLVAGSYLLTAVAPAGFDLPTTTHQGTVVVLADGQQKTDGHAYLYAKQVAFDVKVVDQHGQVVTDADSVKLTKNTPPAGPSAGDTSATRTGSGAATRYGFTAVVPGTWTIWASGPGFSDASVTPLIRSSASGTATEVTLTVNRSGARISGSVTTPVDGTPTALAGVRVTFTCATGTSTPPAFCPAGQPARGTDNSDLTVLTGADGSWSFPNVPAGTFDIGYTKQGYGAGSGSVSVTADVDQALTAVPLQGVNRNVVVVLDPTQPGDTGLGATSLSLVPRGSTPGSAIVQTSMTRGSDGSYTATFNGVRWGCYRLDLALPTGHHGTPVGPTGSPAGADLGCPGDADVRVPDDGTSAITLGYTLEEAGLSYTLTSSPWTGHAVPATTVTVDGPGTANDLTITTAPASGTVWLPPASYTVTPSVPTGDAPYWTATGTGALSLTGTTTVPAPITLAENTFPVTVTVTGLPSGEEALLQVSAGVLQSGALPDPASATTVGGTATFLLPRGKWLIEGSWTTGPDAAVVDVVPCGQSVALGTTPASTPVACP